MVNGEPPVSRRDFLKIAGAGLGALAFKSFKPPPQNKT